MTILSKREARSRRRRGALAVVAAMTLIAAGCGDDDDDTGDDDSDDTEATTAETAAAPGGTDADTSDEETASTDGETDSTDAETDSADAGEPVAGGEAEVLLYSEIGGLDPVTFTGSGGAEAQRAFTLYGALVTYDADLEEVVPVLAESFESNDDFTEWTLTLKPGIVFSDGSPFDAAAVKANWDRAKDPANRSPSFTALLATGDIEVVDDLTLRIPLNAPNAHFPNSVSRAGMNYIASAEAIEAGTDLTSEAVGAGPFLLESWTRDDRMILTPNPDWIGSDGPYLDGLTFRVVGDEEQRLDTFITGQADGFYTATPASVIRAEDEVDGAEYTSVEVTTGQAYTFNTSQPPFDDIRVRKAFIQGVDWQALSDAVFGEGSVALDNFTLEDTPLYTPDAALPEYDPAAAQAYIDEYIAETGDSALQIEILVFQQSLDQSRAQFVQTSLSQLDNIEVTLTVNDSPTNIGLVLGGDYMMSSWGYPVVFPDPGVYNAVHSEALTNYSKYSNPDVDAMIEEARATDDIDAAAELFQQVFVQLAEDLPYYPYVETNNGFVTSPELHGADVYEDGILRTDMLWMDS